METAHSFFLDYLVILLFLSWHKKRAPKEQREMTQNEMPLWEERKVFGAKIKNMWEGQ